MDTNQINAANNAALSAPVTTGFAAYREDTQHSFIRPYDPKAIAIPGYRHSVIRYRDTSKGTAIKPAQMVTIPQVSLPDDYLMPELAAKVFLGVIEDTQDLIVRRKIEEKVSLIDWINLSVDSCLADLTATRVSQRITKEQIEGWARVALKEAFDTRAAQISSEKNHNPEQIKAQRAGTENAYVANLSKLAAPVPNLGMETANTLQTFLKAAALDDDMAKTLLNKLHAILNPVAADDGNL